MTFSSALLMITMTAPVAVPPCVDEVSTLLQREAFADAIVAAAECGAKTAHPRCFYLAGVARIALGQHAHAILQLQRYMAEDAPDEPKRLRDVARSRLDQAKALAVPMLLRIDAGDGEISVRAAREEQGGEPLETPLTALEERDGSRVLWLDPGRHRITVDGEGYLRATRAVTLVVGAPQVVLNLSLRAPVAAAVPPPPPVKVFPQRAWFALTGAVGGMNVLAGVSMLSLGWVRGNHQLDMSAASCRPIDPIDRCRGAFAKAVTLNGAGAGFLGAGLGVLTGGLTALVRGPSGRKLAWRVEAALGGGVLLAGAVLLGVSLRGFNQVNTDASLDAQLWEVEYKYAVSARGNQYTVGAGLVGAGVGLGASAALGLLVQRFVPANTTAAGRWQVRPQGLAVAF
jgi:hypothetical protein